MSGIRVDAVELRRIALPLVRPFRTSFGTWTARDVLLVRVRAGEVEGWGECVAGSEPSYSSEYTAGCHAVTRDHLLPLLFAAEVRGGADVDAALGAVRGHRMAKAAVEAAVVDAELRAAGVSLAAHLGASRSRVPVGVSVGITPTLEELVAVVGDHLEEGYGRIKIKIEPGWDLEPVRALRASFGDDFGLQVDANAAYRPGDLDQLRALDAFGLLLLEQPYPEEWLLDNVALAEALATPVCLDESIVSIDVARDALALGAASIINIKPGRIGGHLAGRRLHDLCVEAGAPVWHGGMLETGIGRAANLALAALDGFTLPGDISAAERYWARDVVADPAVLEADGTIRVPDGPGSGVDVDLDYLDAVTTSSEWFEAP